MYESREPVYRYTTIWMLSVYSNVCIVDIIFISVVITVNYCKCIWLFSPLNSHLYNEL